MKIIEEINKLKSMLEKAKNGKDFISYEGIKKHFDSLIKNLLDNNIIDKNSYDLLINKLYGKDIQEEAIVSSIRTASIKNQVIVMMLLSCISMINAGEIKQHTHKNFHENKQVKKMNKEISDAELTKKAFEFIKKYEGEVIGNVYDKNGKIIAKDVHVVYDDKLPVGNKNKKWNGSPFTLQGFMKQCKGIPTIGYGIIDKDIVSKGWMTQADADKAAQAFLQKILGETKKKFGEIYWNKLNTNQKIALLALHYNTGVNIKTPKMISYIQNGDYQNAAKEFLDITKSGGVTLNGLVDRRKDEAKLFLTPVS